VPQWFAATRRAPPKTTAKQPEADRVVVGKCVLLGSAGFGEEDGALGPVSRQRVVIDALDLLPSFRRHVSLGIRFPIQDNGDGRRHFGGGVDKEALPVGEYCVLLGLDGCLRVAANRVRPEERNGCSGFDPLTA
jgi:hypothetical protein